VGGEGVVFSIAWPASWCAGCCASALCVFLCFCDTALVHVSRAATRRTNKYPREIPELPWYRWVFYSPCMCAIVMPRQPY
jgi:hypothetical protein